MLKKISYVLSLFCLLLIIGYLLMHLFKSGKPMSNTEEYLTAHGYVDGQVNEIRVGNTLLRFPVGVKYSPETENDIVNGRADVVIGGFSHQINAENSSHLDMVRVEFRPYIVGTLIGWENQIEKTKWKKIVQRNDLDLVEYQQEVYGYTYVAKSRSDITPDGKLIQFGCSNVGEKITDCWSIYVHKNKTQIELRISGENLKNWKAIYAEAVKFVNSIIVEE